MSEETIIGILSGFLIGVCCGFPIAWEIYGDTKHKIVWLVVPLICGFIPVGLTSLCLLMFAVAEWIVGLF